MCSSDLGAVGFDWSFEGTFGGSIDSGDATSRVIVVLYTNNGASTSTDNVVFRYNYNNGCTYSTTPVKKAIGLPVIPKPAAPTVTNTVLNNNVCGGRKVRYSVPLYTLTTTAAATGYNWSFNGTGLHASGNYEIDSMDAGGLSASRVIVVRYISNAAQTTADLVTCAYTTACGNGATSTGKAPGLTAVLAQPAAPTVTNTVLNNNVCSGRKVRFSVPVTPAAGANIAAATGYSWQIAGSVLHATEGVTYVIDSGSLTSREIGRAHV